MSGWEDMELDNDVGDGCALSEFYSSPPTSNVSLDNLQCPHTSLWQGCTGWQKYVSMQIEDSEKTPGGRTVEDSDGGINLRTTQWSPVPLTCSHALHLIAASRCQGLERSWTARHVTLVAESQTLIIVWLQSVDKHLNRAMFLPEFEELWQGLDVLDLPFDASGTYFEQSDDVKVVTGIHIHINDPGSQGMELNDIVQNNGVHDDPKSAATAMESMVSSNGEQPWARKLKCTGSST